MKVDNLRSPNGFKGSDVVRERAFGRGLAVGHDATRVVIALNRVWSASLKSGGTCFSYEKVGYHAGSVEFIEGVLSAECPVEIATLGENGKIKWEKVEK